MPMTDKQQDAAEKVTYYFSRLSDNFSANVQKRATKFKSHLEKESKDRKKELKDLLADIKAIAADIKTILEEGKLLKSGYEKVTKALKKMDADAFATEAEKQEIQCVR